jgi:AraC-like DNA-binding protein
VGRHLNELALAMALHLCRAHTGGAVAVREVWFVNARPRGTLDTLAAHFGTSALHFGHVENSLQLDAGALDTPQQTADARLLATAEGLAEEALRERLPAPESFSARVEAQVRERLKGGEPSMRTVALALRMSTRTLQRRLEAEGQSYLRVLDAVRERLAREWVTAPAPTLSEVAFELGFAEFATFSRAFKRWTGVAPGAFRQGRSTDDR